MYLFPKILNAEWLLTLSKYFFAPIRMMVESCYFNILLWCVTFLIFNIYSLLIIYLCIYAFIFTNFYKYVFNALFKLVQ